MFQETDDSSLFWKVLFKSKHILRKYFHELNFLELPQKDYSYQIYLFTKTADLNEQHFDTGAVYVHVYAVCLFSAHEMRLSTYRE